MIEEFHTLVKPDHKVPHFIEELTGISNEMLKDAPDLEDAGSKLIEFLGNSPIVAQHCILEETFLNAWIAPLRDGELYTAIESIQPIALSYPELPSYSLENLRLHFKISQDAPHRALNDVKDLLEILKLAHQNRVKDNPKIKALFDFLYPSDEAKDSFWWSWFFKTETKHPYSSLLDVFKSRQRLGDLRQLKQQDQDLEIDWTKSTSSPDELSEILRHDGILGYGYRESQAIMADQIRQSFNTGKRVLIEAPTGVGKSLGYLIPGYLSALKSGAPVIISTHSKGLQDQLLNKDIPKLKELTHDEDIRGAVVKGQNNYLCMRKLFEQTLHLEHDSPKEERFALFYISHLAVIQPILELDRISSYVRNRFEGVQQLIDFVKSHHTTTLGPPCPFYSTCHFFDSARLAHESSVIIANHALVLNWPAHLPKIRNIVFDEAHHLEDQLTQALKFDTNEEQVKFLIDRIAKKRGSRWVGDGVMLARNTHHIKLVKQGSDYEDLDLEDWITELSESLRTRLTHIESLFLGLKSLSQDTGYDEHFVIDQPRYSKNPGIMAIIEDFLKIDASFEKLEKWLVKLSEALEGQSGTRDISLDSCLFLLSETQSVREALKYFCLPVSKETQNLLRILKINFKESTWGIEVLPIEIAEHAKPIWTTLRSIILTSATLTTANQLDFVAKRIGLELTELPIQLGSPFRLDKQAQILIPKDIAPPGTPSHFDALMDYTSDVVTGLKGRTLLLLTSNRRLRTAVERLKERLEPRGIDVLDGLSDSKAVEVFKNSKQALLIGTERHGEGVDIPGVALSCVIIEKINESMTRGPLAEARKTKTKFPLFDYDFPLRMIWLKQRLGRLIRSPDDFGSIVIFDARFYGWSPGSQNVVRKTLTPYPILEGTREQLLFKLLERDKIGLSTNAAEFGKTLESI